MQIASNNKDSMGDFNKKYCFRETRFPLSLCSFTSGGIKREGTAVVSRVTW